MRLNQTKRRGFTLAETVVSMTLTVLITLTVFASLKTVSRLNEREKAYRFLINEAHNAYACMLSEKPEAALAFYIGVPSVIPENGLLYDSELNYTEDRERAAYVIYLCGEDYRIACYGLRNGKDVLVYSWS